MISKIGHQLYRESGLSSVRAAGRDAWLVILSRTCRMFAYGGAGSLILALFFAELGVPDSRIGLFMSLTLVGDVALSLLITLVADNWLGRRRSLLAGSVLMVLSGTTFALCENYWVLLVAAVLGIVSATGTDVGPFRAIEESTLSELTGPQTRADVLAWYVTSAALGQAAGIEISGRVIERLRKRDGWTLLDAYHLCFWLYVVMGVVGIVASLLLSDKCELRKPSEKSSETEAFLRTEEPETSAGRNNSKSRFAQISRETLSVVSVLWFLLMVDSLADGMVGMSLTTYYMDQKFGQRLSKATLGDVVSASYFLAACSTVFSGHLSRRLGLVNTMVFTHIPSSTAVLLFPFPPGVVLTVTLLLLRMALNNMDQAPRTALIAAVVRPEERTAVMGITSMLRTLASTVGPFITGVLSGNDRFWLAFVMAGSLRLAYDLGLFAMFINIKLYKHEPVAEGDEHILQERPADDEELSETR
ncbi:major facilitator superfamily domain-containing protein [Mycena metata]|uniref:Major facilitator superfamily domain-containing protein n=1 Tax=Mycena metata TaxID=1033252 RepID=A0AAD7KGY6_9AGAR|nr:major facilitator superfamily domain-containing protein [Mycena metata]